ncbi:hypothetical protein [Acaryochloris marina]|uniref:hypothetical protein n=1 Tax=Acaryochloris marina TaxID=155978 RepID=UPI0011D099CC|nr:hypothetical protein [Acaryochloris marina]
MICRQLCKHNYIFISLPFILNVFTAFTAFAQELPYAVLEDVSGDVKVMRRQENRRFQPIYQGEKLHSGDLLKLNFDARARVRCPDRTSWHVPVGTISGVNNGCSFSKKRSNINIHFLMSY